MYVTSAYRLISKSLKVIIINITIKIIIETTSIYLFNLIHFRHLALICKCKFHLLFSYNSSNYILENLNIYKSYN